MPSCSAPMLADLQPQPTLAVDNRTPPHLVGVAPRSHHAASAAAAAATAARRWRDTGTTDAQAVPRTHHARAWVDALTHATRLSARTTLAGAGSVDAAPVAAAAQAGVAAGAAARSDASPLLAYALASAGHAGTWIDAATEFTLLAVRTHDARAGRVETDAVAARSPGFAAEQRAGWVDALTCVIASEADRT